LRCRFVIAPIGSLTESNLSSIGNRMYRYFLRLRCGAINRVVQLPASQEYARLFNLKCCVRICASTRRYVVSPKIIVRGTDGKGTA
jgi:hypothetical protein